jgi:hypothetical protein
MLAIVDTSPVLREGADRWDFVAALIEAADKLTPRIAHGSVALVLLAIGGNLFLTDASNGGLEQISGQFTYRLAAYVAVQGN